MKYELMDVLGEGTYGKVFRGKIGDEYVAIKRIKASATNGESGIHFTTIREIKVMKQMANCDNIVPLLDVYSENLDLYLVMPLLPMDLKQIIQDKSLILSMAHIKCIMKQILTGVNHLHEHFILSRDISPANILINPNTGKCLIADFGLARSYGTPYPGILGRKRTFGGIMTPTVVTLWYRAPELLFGSIYYGPQIDIWATACVFAELLPRKKEGSSMQGNGQIRQALFPGQHEIDQLTKIFELLGTPSEVVWKEAVNFPKFVRFTHLPPPGNCWVKEAFDSVDSNGPGIDKIIKSMLSLDPNFRPSAENLLQDEFFTKLSPKPCSEITLAKQVFQFKSRK
jgi:cyclin-dependent kinase 7